MSALAVNPVGYDPLRDSRHRNARAARECADWLAWLEIEGKAARTLDDYERTAAVLLRMFPRKTIAEITEGDLLHVLKTFPRKSQRIRRAHLSSFTGWAYRTGLIPGNTIDRVPKPKREPRKVVPTFPDIDRAELEALPYPDGPLFKILFGTGIRKGEARRLRCRHIDLSRGTLTVYNGKGGKDRVVPLKGLAQPLSEWFLLDAIEPGDHLWYSRPGGGPLNRIRPIGEGSYHRWYVRCLQAASIAHLNPHTTRHTFALNWLRRGGRLETLSLVLGHESIKTTFDEYGHLDVSDIAFDMELVEG